MDRRTLLRSGLPLVAVGLAGCTGDDRDGDGGDADSPSPSPTASPEPTGTPTASPTESPTASPEPTETETPLPDVAQVVAVGPGGDLRFEPDSFEVAVGDTVRWEWESGGHNVSPTRVADGSDWSGHDDTLYQQGTTHAHSFEVAGSYRYICQPHEGAGMTGSFTVTE